MANIFATDSTALILECVVPVTDGANDTNSLINKPALDCIVNPAEFLAGLLHTAIAAVSAEKCLPDYLPALPKGRTIVIGAGKAAAAMAACVEQHWQGALSGLVITPYGHAVPCKSIEVIEAAHPVPDNAGQQAALRMLEMVKGLSADDLVLCLMSGGGSALLTIPAEGVEFEQKRDINKALLRSGATIFEMNCVRKHLSAIKGGRLALACAPAKVVTLAISDIPGDDPAIIASGPTLADASTCAEALAILQRYKIVVPAFIAGQLTGNAWETPKPGDQRFTGHTQHVIATAQHALEAAATAGRKSGLAVYILSAQIEGEARDAGTVHGAIALQVQAHGQPFTTPCLVLSGGETTVTVNGTGQGGRNTEFLLGLANKLNGQPGIYALAADTDGIDGNTGNCGALLMPESLAQVMASGLSPSALLANNDGYRFFEASGGLVVTGPTRTNVNDFRAMLILEAGSVLLPLP